MTKECMAMERFNFFNCFKLHALLYYKFIYHLHSFIKLFSGFLKKKLSLLFITFFYHHLFFILIF